jgi:hypothetical protein
MLYRSTIGVLTIAIVALAGSAAQAFDESKYPNLKGKWERLQGPAGIPRFALGPVKAPLTPEYQAIYNANVASQTAGGHGDEPSYACLPPGMPRIMNVFEPMEIVVTPETTHILIAHIHDNRRVYTDGRDWPEEIEPSFHGYSIGQWIDTDGDGRYDLLEIETRGMKGPRTYDTTGLPLHHDNQTIIKERIYLDKADPGLLHDDITTIDHALTEPWTVHKTFERDKSPQPSWLEEVCEEHNEHVRIGTENYFLGANGVLMPTHKDQAPPDLRYFKPVPK